MRAACHAVGAAQAGYYRRHRTSPAPPRPTPIPHRDRPQPRALTEHEQHAILDVLHSQRFIDAAPAQVWATLLGSTSGRSRRFTDCCAKPAKPGNGAARPATPPA